MNITININEVLRDVLSRFEEIYEKYHDKKVKSEIITPNLLDYVDFEDDEELFTFLYEEAPMEIFGQAKEVDNNVISHLVELYKGMPQGYKLRLASDDFGKSKAATLWFLAKYGVVVDEIIFYTIKQIDYVWSLTDVFITADIDIIEKKPSNKKIIVIDKPYNTSLDCELRINTLKDVDTFEGMLK